MKSSEHCTSSRPFDLKLQRSPVTYNVLWVSRWSSEWNSLISHCFEWETNDGESHKITISEWLAAGCTMWISKGGERNARAFRLALFFFCGLPSWSAASTLQFSKSPQSSVAMAGWRVGHSCRGPGSTELAASHCLICATFAVLLHT